MDIPDRFTGIHIGAVLGKNRAPNSNSNPLNRTPLNERHPKAPEAPKPIPQQENEPPKGSLRGRVKEALIKAADARKTIKIEDTDPRLTEAEKALKEQIKEELKKLEKIQEAAEAQIAAEDFPYKPDLNTPAGTTNEEARKKHDETVAQLMKDEAQQKKIAKRLDELLQRSLAESLEKPKTQERILQATTDKRTELTHQNEDEEKRLIGLSEADAKGRIKKQKMVNGEPVFDKDKNPVYENIPVNSEILAELKAVPGQEDLAEEFEEMLQNESVLDVAAIISEELLKNPDTKLIGLRDSIITLQGMYRLCQNDNDREGMGTIAAFMHQEISGINVGQVTSNADIQKKITDSLGKNSKAVDFNSRLTILVNQVRLNHRLPENWSNKDFDKKNILKTLIIANYLRSHPGSIVVNEQSRSYEIGPPLRDIMNTSDWKLGELDREFAISMFQKGTEGEISEAFHLGNLKNITSKEGQLKLVKSAVDDTIDRLGEDPKNRDKRIKEEMAFWMKAFNNIKDKKEKSAWLGAIGPILLAALLSGQSLLSFGVEEGGSQQRH